jgi:hypothetical protein
MERAMALPETDGGRSEDADATKHSFARQKPVGAEDSS